MRGLSTKHEALLSKKYTHGPQQCGTQFSAVKIAYHDLVLQNTAQLQPLRDFREEI